MQLNFSWVTIAGVINQTEFKMSSNHANHMYRCSATAWDLAFSYYGSASNMTKICGTTTQAIYNARGAYRFPAHWAARMHRDSKGVVDVRITRPDLYAGIV